MCTAWEDAAKPAGELGVRTVLMRLGNVLDLSGGYLAKSLQFAQRLPLLTLGEDERSIPWISLRDAVEMFQFALNGRDISGPMNVTAPSPVTQRRFMELIAKLAARRIRGRVSARVLGVVLGEFSRALTDDQRVIPAAALAHGFRFEHPDFETFERAITGRGAPPTTP